MSELLKRLEKIKYTQYTFLETSKTSLEADMRWLIDQVEKYDEMIDEFLAIQSREEGMKGKVKRYEFTYREADSDRKKLQKKNKQYRESLLEIKSVPYDASGMSCGVMLSTIESLVNRVLEESK